MIRLKRINILVLTVCILLHNLPLFAQLNVSTNEDTSILEMLSIDEIETNQELNNFITEHNGFELIEQEQGELRESVYTQIISEAGNDLSIDDIEELNDRYSLSEPLDEYLEPYQQILVERNATTKAIDNVWYLTYYTSGSSFSIKVLNIHSNVSDPLDSLSGNLYLYRLSKRTWYKESQVPIAKTQIKSGNVYTWNISSKYVKEKFEYDLTIVEDGVKWTYNNIDKDNHVRYNFDAGPYSTISANGGERHHFVSSYALGNTGYNTSSAYAIRMMYDDHIKTGSWGSSASSTTYRNEEVSLINNGKYQDLLQKEVDDLKSKRDSEGSRMNLCSKYYDEVIECLYAYEKLFGL